MARRLDARAATFTPSFGGSPPPHEQQEAGASAKSGAGQVRSFGVCFGYLGPSDVCRSITLQQPTTHSPMRLAGLELAVEVD